MNHQQKSERDELRARFTVWLETTVYRARLKYLEREKPKVDTVSINWLIVFQLHDDYTALDIYCNNSIMTYIANQVKAGGAKL